MGRPSKLSESQWSKLRDEQLKGATLEYLAKKYGTSKSAISGKFGNANKADKAFAETLADVEQRFAAMPPAQQRAVRNMADEIKAINFHLANAATSGAFVAAKLARTAANQVAQIDEVSPTPDDLSRVNVAGGMMKVANESSVIARDLVRANNESNAAPPEVNKAELLRDIADSLPD